MKNKVLILVAHPDDETIGCGATIAKHVADGDQVKLLALSSGVGSRDKVIPHEKEMRIKCAKKAANILGTEWISFGDFNDNKFDQHPLLDIVKYIENVKKKFFPNILYTHSGYDLNVDHRVTFAAGLTAFRPIDYKKSTEIRSFELRSSSDFSHPSLAKEFTPNLFNNIDKFWSKKLKALKSYKSEIMPFPHSRSLKAIESLAIHRGAQVGVKMAEAFEVIRKIKP